MALSSSINPKTPVSAFKSELLNNDERKSYLDEKSTKSYKAKIEEEEDER